MSTRILLEETEERAHGKRHFKLAKGGRERNPDKKGPAGSAGPSAAQAKGTSLAYL
jgi:hypothetical protein